MSTTERRILTAPDAVAKRAARFTPDPEQRWMLCQQVWMLRQPESVRESYIADVLLAADG